MGHELKNLAQRTTSLKNRLDDVTTVFGDHEENIGKIQEKMESLRDKIEDLEKCSRKSNIGIIGLPKTITDTLYRQQ